MILSNVKMPMRRGFEAGLVVRRSSGYCAPFVFISSEDSF
jgi:hypothetical protein